MAKRTAIEAAKEHSFAALKAAANRLRAVQRTAFDVLPISERTYIERVLEFASWDGADAKRFMQLSLKLQIGCAVIGITGEQQDLKLTRALQATVASTGLSLAVSRRNNIRQSLKAIADAYAWMQLSKPPRRSTGPAMKAIETGRDTRGHAVAIWRGQEPLGEPMWMFFPFNLAAAIKIALDLLQDSTRPYGRLLRQCQRQACGGYFLLPAKPSRGQPTNMHAECKQIWRNVERHK